MSILLFIVLHVLLSAAVVGQSPHHESGVLHSSLNLTSPFDASQLIEIIWNHKINGSESRIVKIQNGELVEKNNRYELFNNGTVLCINNLTESGCGLYTIEVTFSDNTMKYKEINVTIREELKSGDSTPMISPINIVVVAVVVVVVAMVCWMCWKKSSSTSGQEVTSGYSVQKVIASIKEVVVQKCQCWKRSCITGQDDQKEGMQTNQKENVVKEHEKEEYSRIPVDETETEEYPNPLRRCLGFLQLCGKKEKIRKTIVRFKRSDNSAS